jgi:hypothetical protein
MSYVRNFVTIASLVGATLTMAPAACDALDMGSLDLVRADQLLPCRDPQSFHRSRASRRTWR